MLQPNRCGVVLHNCTPQPFHVKPCQVNLNEVNTNTNKYSYISQQFDFSKEDEAPEGPFNEVIWKAVMGISNTCTAPVHAAFLKTN